MSLFIDSGAGLVLSMVLYSRGFEQRKKFYNCEANSLGVLWRRTNHLHVYRRLLTNRLHCKEAELCLANS